MILVVDDHASTRTVFVKLLNRMGYDAAAASCTEEALSLMRRQKPRFVILDYPCSDMDGLALLGVMRSDESLADIPVYLTSEEVTVKAEAEHLEVVGFDVKPIQLDRLFETITNTLKTPVPLR